MNDKSLQFTPSKVDGFSNVTQVNIYPEFLKILSGNQWSTFRFDDIAKYPKPRIFWQFLKHIGLYSQPSIGERDWFHSPYERFIRFYTEPAITIYMPVDELKEYLKSYF